MVFGHYEIRAHPARLADIEVVGPMAVVGELVLGKSPWRVSLADGFRHARMVLKGPNQAELPVSMLGGEFFTTLVVEGRPIPVVAVVHADEVGGNAAGVVAVGFDVF